MQNLNTYEARYKNNNGKSDIPPSTDNNEQSMPINPNTVLNKARNAKSIGITFSVPSIILYVLLSGNLSTIRIPCFLYTSLGYKRLWPCCNIFIKKSLIYLSTQKG